MKHLTKKRLSRWLTLAAVATLTAGLGGTVQTVKAADDIWTHATDLNGNRFPEPLDPDTGLPAYVPFDQAMTTDGITGTSSKVLSNAAGNNVAVQLTNGKTQSGSIWSTSKLKLQQTFSTKMHIYFGNNPNPADGMAFVLRGDKPTQVYQNGSGVGVWGAGTNLNIKGQMPNAFAVTFDTYFNGDTTDKNVDKIAAGFSSSDDAQYIGWGFPGFLNGSNSAIMQYQRGDKGQLLFDKTNAADGGLNKTGYGTDMGLGGYYVPTKKSGEKFTDGQWHTVKVDWAPDTAKDGGGSLTFSIELSSSHTFSKTMTWTAADITKIFGTTAISQGVSWGFTGSTGAQAEEGVVTFETIPGVVDASVAATVISRDGSAAPKSVYEGDALAQTYTITYNSSNSKQNWPVQNTTNTATLTGTLRTTTGYGFEVNANGKVSVTILRNGVTQTAVGIPTKTAQVTDKFGQTKTYATQVDVSLPGFLNSISGVQSYTVTAPILAAKKNDAATEGAGVVVGNNARYTTTVSTPAVLENPLGIGAPNFLFKNLSVGQIIKGLSGVTGTMDGTGNLVAAAPTGVHTTITASMTPVNFPAGTGYTAGNTTIGFTYSGRNVTLPDNNTAQTVYSADTPPTSGAITNLKLGMQPYPQIKLGNYTSTITWTIAATPIAG
ncbi:MAG: hypothetical protein LKJ46_10305 [Lactobacillus sp.]|jgi:hypothetical protein|uniref:lectin-like domain-containing protein n=1 Tax=Lacticaseibacillus suilingensis TaxID=2799577 RepID=UPI0022E6D3E7|nr:hypothetical protein [Lacticaseibacillus suilingensis]MCI1895107.1 hypothetical protein [Lactobacillus sp.]MCI1917539.1 hypothetical protein [Lactobacillus sp.]MCI1973000.1 hypothetical protein [Lactobacillus sp.]MCI2017170.1 hypothetical protein [Lactobacillus sp.]MCI2037531.1 hypothetical protein [Lactobacillus sp.]